MKRSEDGKYDMCYGWEVLGEWTTMKQGNNESLPKFHDRFERQAEMVKAQLGNDIFKLFAKTTKGYVNLAGDATRQTVYVDNSFEMMKSTGFLFNSDTKRSGELIKSLREDYVKGNDHYPKTMDKAHSMMQTFMEMKPSPGVDMYQQKKGNFKKKGDSRAERKTSCHQIVHTK